MPQSQDGAFRSVMEMQQPAPYKRGEKMGTDIMVRIECSQRVPGRYLRDCNESDPWLLRERQVPRTLVHGMRWRDLQHVALF